MLVVSVRHTTQKVLHYKRINSIGLVRNFLRFFRKFPRAAEKVLEYSLLRVYIGGMNTV